MTCVTVWDGVGVRVKDRLGLGQQDVGGLHLDNRPVAARAQAVPLEGALERGLARGELVRARVRVRVTVRVKG